MPGYKFIPFVRNDASYRRLLRRTTAQATQIHLSITGGRLKKRSVRLALFYIGKFQVGPVGAYGFDGEVKLLVHPHGARPLLGGVLPLIADAPVDRLRS